MVTRSVWRVLNERVPAAVVLVYRAAQGAVDCPGGCSMNRVIRVVLLPVAVMLLSSVASPVAAATPPPLPASMAALGDSITRAYDVCCSYSDHPGQSWSTGYAWYDGISSHYERIKRAKPSIAGQAYNDAVTGAKMAAAPGQAAKAVTTQGVSYVTILVGANDLCTSSPETMTSPDSFRGDFATAMDTLARDPSRHIFVSSIPNLHQLWELLHTNALARTVWASAHICQSMLGANRKPEERQQVVKREERFNEILAEICARYPNCRWDDGATYSYRFSVSQVSPLDFFHPSLSGQAALAQVTWAKSWWPTT
jgi:lysophospholipase L1-like esterase